jgi:AraC family transcriptional regulator, transcriptional activator of pobA
VHLEATRPSNKAVPNFALYGAAADEPWVDLVHYERIPVRSRLFGWEIEPHFHDALIQVLYPTQGGGETFIDGKTWTLRPPCLIVAPARSVHGFHFASNIDGSVITMAQSPLESLAIAAAPELLAFIRKPAVLEVGPDSRHGAPLLALFEAIEREAATQERWQFAAGMSLAFALFVQVARISQDAELSSNPARTRLASRIERFRALLDEHCRRRLSVDVYAKAMRVTPGQLTRMSREALGMSAIDAIDARSIHEAKRELAYSTLSVKQIAGELGFRDEAYFSRFFRKQTGLRPTQFRAMAHDRLAVV